MKGICSFSLQSLEMGGTSNQGQSVVLAIITAFWKFKFYFFVFLDVCWREQFWFKKLTPHASNCLFFLLLFKVILKKKSWKLLLVVQLADRATKSSFKILF